MKEDKKKKKKSKVILLLIRDQFACINNFINNYFAIGTKVNVQIENYQFI